MVGVLKRISGELNEENISAFACDLLQDAETELGTDTEGLDDSDVQDFLDDQDVSLAPKKKKRKMPGYRRVTQKLSSLFDFDLYLEKAKSYYVSEES